MAYNLIGGNLMFGTNTISRGLSLGKVLNGISKGLTIANQAIPIYEQVKPMVGNAKKLFSIVKELKNTAPEKKDSIKKISSPNVKPETEKRLNSSSPSLPVFFQ